MKSKLSNLHNYFVKEHPLTKRLFSEFPNDFVLYGGAITDYLMESPVTIDYDTFVLNNKWQEVVDYLMTQQPNFTRWEYKTVNVQHKGWSDSFDIEKQEYKKSCIFKGDLPWAIVLQQCGNFDYQSYGSKWNKPGLSILKNSYDSVEHAIECVDSIPNRIAIIKSDVVMLDERPLECIKWRSFEFDGWMVDPQYSLGRCSRYARNKGWNMPPSLEPAIMELMHYRQKTQDIAKPEGWGDYRIGDYAKLELEMEEIFEIIRKKLEIPKRYKLNYTYNQDGLIKE